MEVMVRPTRDSEQLIDFLIYLILPVLQFQLLHSDGEKAHTGEIGNKKQKGV